MQVKGLYSLWVTLSFSSHGSSCLRGRTLKTLDCNALFLSFFFNRTSTCLDMEAVHTLIKDIILHSTRKCYQYIFITFNDWCLVSLWCGSRGKFSENVYPAEISLVHVGSDFLPYCSKSTVMVVFSARHTDPTVHPGREVAVTLPSMF